MKTLTYWSLILFVVAACSKSDEPTPNSSAGPEPAPSVTKPATATAVTPTKVATATKAKTVRGGCEYGNLVRSAEPGVGPGVKGGHSCAQAPTPEPIKTGVSNHYGAKFSEASPVSLSEIFSNPDQYSGKKVLVRGLITKVCKKKGCWFVMQTGPEDTQFMRVTMHNYGFFVPKDCDGKQAVVEGVFRSIEVPESARKHLAEDGKEDPSKIKGSAVELTMIATGVDIKG